MKDAVWSCAAQTLAALSVAVFALKSSWVLYGETEAPTPRLMWVSLQRSRKRKIHTCGPNADQLRVTVPWKNELWGGYMSVRRDARAEYSRLAPPPTGVCVLSGFTYRPE